MKLACPHCGRRAMSAWRKLAIGPRHVRACAACGKSVFVPPVAVAAAVLLPITVGGVTAHVVKSLTLGAAAILTGGIIALLLHLYAVPIAPRS